MSTINPELLQFARHKVTRASGKQAFVPAGPAGGDPAQAGGQEAMAGPVPPMPAMGPEPGAEAGAPTPPTAGEGGGGMSAPEVQTMIQQSIQQAMAQGGMGGKQEKMKVDVNQEVYQIKKLLVQIATEMGLSIPPQLLLGDPAQDQSVPPQEAAQDPLSAAHQPGSAIAPIEPIQGASPGMAAAGGGGGEAAGMPAKAAEHHENGESTSLANQAGGLATRLRATIRAGAA